MKPCPYCGGECHVVIDSLPDGRFCGAVVTCDGKLDEECMGIRTEINANYISEKAAIRFHDKRTGEDQ